MNFLQNIFFEVQNYLPGGRCTKTGGGVTLSRFMIDFKNIIYYLSILLCI